jgi:hypothetical protein
VLSELVIELRASWRDFDGARRLRELLLDDSVDVESSTLRELTPRTGAAVPALDHLHALARDATSFADLLARLVPADVPTDGRRSARGVRARHHRHTTGRNHRS